MSLDLQAEVDRLRRRVADLEGELAEWRERGVLVDTGEAVRSRLARWRDRLPGLRPCDLAALHVLLEHAGQVIIAEALAARVRAMLSNPRTEELLDPTRYGYVIVCTLRKALRRAGRGFLVETIGGGYVLRAEFAPAAAAWLDGRG